MRKRSRALSEREIRTLEAIIDYAIVEGAELRLPMFVLLLRAARSELTRHAGAAAAGDAVVGPNEIGLLALRGEKPDDHTSSLKNR
ncbi:MAG TPA: hypothetical protein VGG01_27020 [Xanthobacteraceae bacterium]|jgi:hypothetical protein